MKKITLLIGILVFLITGANAQTTKVSKKIEVLSWINEAVVDGNQVEGGLHSYASWTELNSNLQKAQVKKGMLVTITGESATYRLKSWSDTDNLPNKNEWERVGDVVIVKDIDMRDSLLSSSTDTTALSTGTVVLVKSNDLSVPEAFIYVEDMDGDGTANEDEDDSWFSFSGSSNAGSSNGYVYFTSYAVSNAYTDDISSSSVSFTNGYYSGATTSAAVSGQTKLSAMPSIGADGTGTQVSFDLSSWTSGNVPVVAIPATWNAPSFYIYNGTNYYQLQDCWVMRKRTIDDISYQVWIADNDFITGASSSTLNLIVR